MACTDVEQTATNVTTTTLRLGVPPATAPMPVVLRSLLKVLKRVHGCRCLSCGIDDESWQVKYGDKIGWFWERRIRDDGDTRGILVDRPYLECNACDGLRLFAIGKPNADALSDSDVLRYAGTELAFNSDAENESEGHLARCVRY